VVVFLALCAVEGFFFVFVDADTIVGDADSIAQDVIC
jgi:hypothetical protein